MIYNLEEYEHEIRSVLERLPLCRKKQLIKVLVNTYEGMNEFLANETLLAIQRRGHVFLSTDDWAMTKGMYLRISQDRYFEGVNSNENYMQGCRLGNMTSLIQKNNVVGDEIDCFWLAVDMLPDSKDFIVGCTPWVICFDTSANKETVSRLYQITKIAADKELTRCEILRSLPKIEDNDLKKVITRIALIEDERHAWKIPHIGFSFICVLDPNSDRGYRIVEKRTGKDVWGD